jgi:hypothetical protein
MALFTKYGSFWGMIPQTTGRYFFVAPSGQYTVEGQSYSSSDNNDGLAPDRALRTFNQAVTNCTANVGDVIIGLPGAHSVSATVAVNKAGLTVVGIPGSINRTATLRRSSGAKTLRTTITSTQTAGIIFTISAVDCEIAFLEFLPPAAGGRGISLAPLSGAANRTYIHDCNFKLQATASTTTFGVTVPAGVTADLLEDLLIANCYFLSGTATTTGANGPGVNVLGTAAALTVEQCTFELKGTAAWANAILSSNAGSLGVTVRDCDFVTTASGTAITNCVNTTGQTVDGSTTVFRCYLAEPSKGIVSTATADVADVDSWTANATSGTSVVR